MMRRVGRRRRGEGGVGGRWNRHPRTLFGGDTYDITDGPNHTISLRRHHSVHENNIQADSTQLVCSTGANMSVMVLQGYNYPPEKMTT